MKLFFQWNFHVWWFPEHIDDIFIKDFYVWQTLKILTLFFSHIFACKFSNKVHIAFVDLVKILNFYFFQLLQVSTICINFSRVNKPLIISTLKVYIYFRVWRSPKMTKRFFPKIFLRIRILYNVSQSCLHSRKNLETGTGWLNKGSQHPYYTFVFVLRLG